MGVLAGGEEEPGNTARGFRRRTLSTSGYLTPALLALLSAVLIAASLERGHGHYHRLRSHVVTDEQAAAGPTGPGGQPALQIRRSTTVSSSQPEFVSATLLPGRGMNVLQITASVPGRGEIPLLFSPDLGSLSQVLTASGPDAYGAMSSTFGGAILAPWAGQLSGVPTANRTILQAVWQGQRLTFPAGEENSTRSAEGLLLNRAADTVETSSIPGGKTVQAVFHAGSFSGSWPSILEIHVSAELAAHDFNLAVVVKNTGQAAAPVGIGWHPFFALPAEVRRRVLLSVPSTQGVPREQSAHLEPLQGNAMDFSSPRGTPLGEGSLDTIYTHLQKGVLSEGPVIELRYPSPSYALRLTLLADAIQNVRVLAPLDRPWISILPATNLDNGLDSALENTLKRASSSAQTSAQSGGQSGGQSGNQSGGLATLQPGDSLRWRVRLEISPLP